MDQVDDDLQPHHIVKIIGVKVRVNESATFWMIVRNLSKASQFILRQHYCDLPFRNHFHCHCKKPGSLECKSAGLYFITLVRDIAPQIECYCFTHTLLTPKCCVGWDNISCARIKNEWGSVIIEVTGHRTENIVESLTTVCHELGLMFRFVHNYRYIIITGTYDLLWWRFFVKLYYNIHVAPKRPIHAETTC